MRVFVTGSTGWVGSVVVRELIGAGHQVVGLARDPVKAGALEAAGAAVLHGTLDDLDALGAAARDADAVAHLAFNHDFSRFAENAAQEARAVEAIGDALEGTSKILLVTSGVALLSPGRVSTEDDQPSGELANPRRSEQAAAGLADKGVRAAAVRLPPTTHGVGDHGFVRILYDLAREKGVSAYVGDGTNRWPAAHVSDAGRLYRLALETGATLPAYHAIAEEGVPFRAIAEAIGRQLGVPAEPREVDHFGWFGMFAAADIRSSGAKTREATGWAPNGRKLLDDLADPAYFT